MRTLLTISSVLLCIISKISADTRCVRVHGQVQCATDRHRHDKVQITLMDKDGLPWESDDQMGVTWTDDNGNFMVEGCGNDFGFWNHPDPFLVVDHRCPLKGHTVAITHRKTFVELKQNFMPTEQRIGIIRIDIDQQG